MGLGGRDRCLRERLPAPGHSSGGTMLSVETSPATLCDGISRREWLRVGGLSVVGLSLPDLLRAQGPPAPAAPTSPLGRGLEGVTFGRAQSVIFLWLQGGPPQHET